ncbi:MAG: zf-HC2 domain-containing protein [Gemmatimonadaceae bacterium]
MHLEEGTIHAWLDGALSPEEGATVEAHVAACKLCAAMVAEARGFIAASSRILSARDDVPASVLPDASTAAEPPVLKPELTLERRFQAPAARPALMGRRRPLYRNPQLVAAAAVLVMAVGTWTVVQRSSGRAAADLAPAAALDAAAPPQNELMDSGALARGTAGALPLPQDASASSIAPARPADERSSSRAFRRAAEPPTSPAAPTTGSGRRTARVAEADASPRRDVPGEATPRAVAPATPALVRQDTADATRRMAAKTTAAERKELAVSPDSLLTREFRRLAGEIDAQRQAPDSARRLDQRGRNAQRSDGMVTGTMQAAAARANPVTPGACYDLARSSAALENEVPPRIRLLEVRGPAIGERLLRQVMVLGAESPVGEWYWWTRPDGVTMLVRLADGAVRYETAMVGIGSEDVKAHPQRCPETRE